MFNKKKNEKYADLMSKLKCSVENEFYYEAIFIEYAILEDRTESILRHAKIDKDIRLTLNDKLKLIEKNIVFSKDEYLHQHITKELLNDIHKWKNRRNVLIHDLVNTTYDNNDIKDIALEGYDITKTLNNKSTLVNKYFDKNL